MASAAAFAERGRVGDDTNSFAGNDSANTADMAEPVTMSTGSMLQIHEHDIQRLLLSRPSPQMTVDVSSSKRVTLPESLSSFAANVAIIWP